MAPILLEIGLSSHVTPSFLSYISGVLQVSKLFGKLMFLVFTSCNSSFQPTDMTNLGKDNPRFLIIGNVQSLLAVLERCVTVLHYGSFQMGLESRL